MKFDTLDLLELFVSEPEFPFGEDEQVYWYKIENNMNIILGLDIYAYENKCNITISCKNQIVPLFKKELKNVLSLVKKVGTLYINLENKEFYKVYFEPYFAIRINEED
jgi:hypothetical protein